MANSNKRRSSKQQQVIYLNERSEGSHELTESGDLLIRVKLPPVRKYDIDFTVPKNVNTYMVIEEPTKYQEVEQTIYYDAEINWKHIETTKPRTGQFEYYPILHSTQPFIYYKLEEPQQTNSNKEEKKEKKEKRDDKQDDKQAKETSLPIVTSTSLSTPLTTPNKSRHKNSETKWTQTYDETKTNPKKPRFKRIKNLRNKMKNRKEAKF